MIACGVALAAEPPAAITLLDGQAALLRGTVRYALAEGVRLQNGDIVELGDKGTAQIEFADGCILSLGPKSRFYIGGLTSRGAAKGGGISDFYLMQGWSKLASGKSAAPLRITTPVFGLGTADATAVIQLADGEGAMFVETGEVRLTEGFVKASPTSPVRLRAGEFFNRKADQKGATAVRPTPGFIAAMPRPYVDNLPSRIDKYREREVKPRRDRRLRLCRRGAVAEGHAGIRRPLMQRWHTKAREPAFRPALIANLRSHPEWDPILFPEKYLPKAAARGARPVPEAGGRGALELPREGSSGDRQ